MLNHVFDGRLRCLCAILTLLSWVFTPTATAQIVPSNAIAVDGDNGSLTPGADGSQWGTSSYKYLQDALVRARNDTNITQIWVAATPGTNPYRPDLGSPGSGIIMLNRGETFELVTNVHVMGGFLGNETNLNQRSPLTRETVLSGNLGGGPASFHVVTAGHLVAVEAILDGFTIRDGLADGSTDLLRLGAGLRTECARVSVVNCRFTNNFAGVDDGVNSLAGFGAAIDSNTDPTTCIQLGPDVQSSVRIYNCRFDNNVAYGAGGGGAISHEGALLIVNSLFHDNMAPGVDSAQLIAGSGGAIYSDGALDLVNCTFAGNMALGSSEGVGFGRGGAIYSVAGTVTGVNCLLWSNEESNEVDPTNWSDQFLSDGPRSV